MTEEKETAHPFFKPSEFSNRVARLRKVMTEKRVDLALFDEIEAMTWIAGYGNSENRWRCVGIPASGEAFFLIRDLDSGPCRQRTWIGDVISFKDWENPMLPLAAAIRQRGLASRRIGLDFNSYSMPLARFAQLKEALPEAEFVDLGPVIWELRLIKSEAEIALLRRASEIADASILAAASACVAGASQRDVLGAAVTTFNRMGAEVAHPGPITLAAGDTFLHGHMDERPLAAGDILHLEVTPRVGGYSAREMRCFSVGRPSDEALALTDKIRILQDQQIAAMQPGALASDVDGILREGFARTGLRTHYDNITGYTLGLYVVQGPRTSDFTRIFHPKANWRLEAGQVFHMYASAGNISLSETVLVTDQGAERLTKLPRALLHA